jgi:hypothetical protein
MDCMGLDGLRMALVGWGDLPLNRWACRIGCGLFADRLRLRFDCAYCARCWPIGAGRCDCYGQKKAPE